MRSPLDRRVALVALAVSATAIVVPITMARARLPGNDHARRDLLVLARRSERASWIVDFDFARVLVNGQRLRERITEANGPPLHIAASGAVVTVDFGNRVASCTTTKAGPRCIEHKEDPSLASSVVYAEVTRLGAYRVEQAADRTIAGEPARCFRLVTRGRAWPQLGAQTEQCYASDGVPLFSELQRAEGSDSRAAVRVERRVTRAALGALLDRLNREQQAGG
jgi:hypothetical protein